MNVGLVNPIDLSARTPVTRAEWVWAVLFAVLVMALTTVPYAIGAARSDEVARFGGFVYGVEDGHSYLGKMRAGARGELAFSLFYTPEAHDPAPLVFLAYSVPGWIVGRFIPADDPALTPALMVVYHGMRVAFGAALIVAVFALVSRFIAGARPRRLATVLATFGGGFGWLLIVSGSPDAFGVPPPEFYIPEGFSWMILLGIPHLALARLALIGGLLALLTALDRERPLRWCLLAAVCWSVMGAVVPFYLAVIYAVLGAWGVAAWIGERRFPARLFVRAVMAAGPTLIPFAYYALVFAGNPAFAVWSAQNVLPSPSPLLYAVGYGLIALLAALSARAVWRIGGVHRLLVAWGIAAPILVYLPINVQRRMSEAVIVPLALLAAFTLTRARPLLRAPLIMLLMASSGILLVVAMLGAARLGDDSPLFQRTEMLAAFDWLNANAVPGSVILSAVETGNALPAYTNLRTYMGHGPETLFWPDKTALLNQFYSGAMPPDARRALLDSPCAPEFACVGPIRYIFYGENERDLETGDPAWQRDPGIARVYEADGVVIFTYTP